MSNSDLVIDETYKNHLIDNHGRPKDKLTLRIVLLFFSPPFPPSKPSFTIKDVSVILAADLSETESIVRQLTNEKILAENLQNPNFFHYNYQCPYIEHQAKLEKYLLEEELKHKFTDSYVELLPFNSN